MPSSSCHETPSIISVFVLFSLLFSPIFSSNDIREERGASMTSKKLINARLRKINKPFVKSIKSPDGDIIDCVLFHLQPAFDLPELRGKMLLIPPELPKGHDDAEKNTEMKQLWNSNGESCPNGSIPIRRTSANDILRSISTSKSGKIYSRKEAETDHEHAIGYVEDGKFYGGKAIINGWQPNVTRANDFSLAQIWVVYKAPPQPVNSVEAGLHIYPNLHPDDNLPRLFVYWTPDGYKSGCYNMLCPGFVQTSAMYCLGAAIDPISTYGGQQYDVTFMIWKDPKNGDWCLQVGSEVMGYWPSTLFPNLRDHATGIEYGGEVYSENSGSHTSTQMGSGHFPDEGFGKAAYIRNLQVINDYESSKFEDVYGLQVKADKPNCYGVTTGYNGAWGHYIFYGGPGNNPNCP